VKLIPTKSFLRTNVEMGQNMEERGPDRGEEDCWSTCSLWLGSPKM